MKKTHKTVILTILGMLIFGGLVLWGFFKMTAQKQEPKEKEPKTEVGKLLKRDIKGNYPGTPREVLKLYGRITKCLYSDEMNQEEQEQLTLQLRLLYDDELLENNPEKEHISNLSGDVKSYIENKQKITGYEAGLASDIEYKTIDSREYAILNLYFIIQQSGKQKQFTKSNEEFLLRKDKDNQWKIVHWKLIEEEEKE